MRPVAIGRGARWRVGWLVALAGPVAIGAAHALADDPRDYVPVAWFLGAVITATALAGRRAGLVATALSTASLGLAATLPRWTLARPWGLTASIVVFAAIALATVRLLVSLEQARLEEGRALQKWSENELRLAGLADANVIGLLTVEDDRIIDANDAFLGTIGYTRDDLDGDGLFYEALTAPEARAADDARRAALLQSGRIAAHEKELVHRAGRRVPVRVGAATISRSPFRWVAFVEDLTERRRLAALEAEARARAERLRHLTAAFVHPLTPQEVGDEVIKVGMPGVEADVCMISLLEPQRRILRTIASHGVPDQLAERLAEVALRDVSPVTTAAATGVPVTVQGLEEYGRAYPDDLSTAADLEIETIACLPLVAGGSVLGVLSFAWRSPRAFAEEELRFLDTLAGLCSTALGRAVRYVEQGELAGLLQAVISPRKLVGPRGFEFADRYVAASEPLQVGGDWHDLFTLDDGSVFFTVGDVVGHGLDAVQDMAQLRLAVRALADQFVDPVVVLERANRVAVRFTRHKFATVCCGLWEPNGTLTVARAGHPYPILRHPDGTTTVVDSPNGPPLGVVPRPVYRSQRLTPALGAVLLVYTDGLVERRGEGIHSGIARLEAVVAGWDGADLTELLQAAVDTTVSTEDDICVLAVRHSGAAIPAPPRHAERRPSVRDHGARIRPPAPDTV